MSKEKFDYRRFHTELGESWVDLLSLDENLDMDDLGQLTISLIEKFAIVDSLYKPLIAMYTLAPSALAKKLPILILSGVSGSGKTTVAKLIGKLRNTELIPGASTFAAIRNQLQEEKYRTEGIENNAILVWEDIDSKIFKEKPDIYRLLKVGYDRSSQWIKISSGKAGENIRFGSFCGKVITTIESIWSIPEYRELDRRIMVVPMQKLAVIPDYLYDVDEYDFSGRHDGFHVMFEKFWTTEANCLNYIQQRKVLSKYGSKLFSSNDWAILADLLATGLITNVFREDDEAIEWATAYMNNLSEIKGSRSSAFLQLLKESIERYEVLQRHLYSNSDEPVCINPSSLKKEIQQWYKNGQIEVNPLPSVVTEYMAKLGFVLTGKGWEKTP